MNRKKTKRIDRSIDIIMPEENQSSIKKKLPLQGVVIFVSQQLAANKTSLHQQCTTLGGKFVWVFDVPFTHYVHQV